MVLVRCILLRFVLAVLAAVLLAGVPPVVASAGSRTFERAVPTELTAEDGWRTPPLAAARAFDLLGARWDGHDGEEHVQLRVRRGDGRWSRWIDAHAGAPVWSGRARAVQLRGERPLRRLRVTFVAVDPDVRSRGAAATSPAARASSAGLRPRIVPRSAWDPRGECRPRTPPRYGRVDFGVVHHTASLTAYPPRASAAMVLAICRFHRDGNRWLDIGYNLLVDRYGTVFEGRAGGADQPVIGSHASGWNVVSSGVAMLGTYSFGAPPAVAQQALARVLAWKLALAGVPARGTTLQRSAGGEENRYRAGALVRLPRIVGHRDVGLTDCPGAALHARLPALRRAVAALQPPPAELLTISPHGVPLEQAAPVWLTGRLARASGRRPAGAEVRLEQRDRTGAWVEVAVTRTGADGVWSAYPRLRENGPVRALAPASGVTSPTVELQVASAVSLRTSPRRLRPDGVLRAAGGTVPPKPAVRLVLERRLASGAYRRVTVRRARTTDGRFAVEIRLRRPGLHRLTALAPADRANATGSSPARTVRVLARR